MNRNASRPGPAKRFSIAFPLHNKKVVWLAEINKYILSEPVASELLQGIWSGDSTESLVRYCISDFDMSEQQAEKLVSDIQKYVEVNLRQQNTSREINKNSNLINTVNFYSIKYYSINEIVFFIEYETVASEALNHPKLAHLEILPTQSFHHHFQVYNSGGLYALKVNGAQIGVWPEAENHLLSGKFSMQILQKIYQMEEDQWMGVFHASGITDGKNCLMFLGDSGNGKSTLSAILMANGLDVLADDFLPVKSKQALVCRFPAAISVKKQAYDIITPQYPELLDAEEYVNPVLNKTFRYLAPKNTERLSVPCKALIFVKYEKNSDFLLEAMPREEAFKELVPDSWISPTAENAKRFISWFNALPCFRLTYSDNKKMIQTIKQMLKDELI